MFSRITRKIYYAARYLQLRARNIKWLFIIGHMRSGSSLLTHLLNSNPEILGYGETHIKYVGRRSLLELRDDVHERFAAHDALPAHHRYTMDKILHPYILDPSVLRVKPLKIVVIVRHPTNALPSILDLDLDFIQTAQRVLKYYRRTLQRMTEWLSCYDRPYLVIDYDELVNRPETVLRRLSDYLDLQEPLTTKYDAMWATGEPGIGDSSLHIHEREITSTSTSYNTEVPSHVITEAQGHYRAFLSKHARYRAGISGN